MIYSTAETLRAQRKTNEDKNKFDAKVKSFLLFKISAFFASLRLETSLNFLRVLGGLDVWNKAIMQDRPLPIINQCQSGSNYPSDHFSAG